MTEPSAAELQQRIETAYGAGGTHRGGDGDREAVEATISMLDAGTLRSAARSEAGWVANEWVKKAILLYFRLYDLETIDTGPFEYRDRIPLKHDYEVAGVRVVPPAVARYGCHLEPGVVLMPSYVNIGARVGRGTMVDTWATVGSCAQIGAGVHLAGGVGIGGVLEPLQARPVVIEDRCFIGSRAIVTEGVVVGEGAVLGANVVLTGSTPVIDVTGDAPREHRGSVPPGAIVIPGTRAKRFPAGEFQVATGLIIGWRGTGTDDKVSLNEALRDFDVAS
ncbi:MAG: 2,3,4,5-tetrahydropyridine-2,6-dicarboxylate N-succinyltransferase [Candidatus Dormiibacterota bacterium]